MVCHGVAWYLPAQRTAQSSDARTTTTMPNTTTTDGLRVAVLSGSYDVDTIRRYLPSNFTAERVGTVIVITGIDSAGWTLDDYVIPRLASGLYRAVEFTPEVAL